jgi:hypothetical protein
MPIYNSRRCSNTLYMFDMDESFSLKGFTAPTIGVEGISNFVTLPETTVYSNKSYSYL